jgi:hypothetical protein
MKIYKSNYRYHWISPYTVLEKIIFWRTIDYEEPFIEKWAQRLMPISAALNVFLDKIHPPINYVKIDRYDTWNMDSTLADIILPMLKQLKATKHGSPYVDDEDLPEELRLTANADWSPQFQFIFDDHEEFKKNSWDLTERQWDYILDEMIFAFQCKVDDSWEAAYSTGEIDLKFVKCEDNPKLSSLEPGPNHTYKIDREGLRKVQERIANGLRLFGKYYSSLWD